MIDTATQTQRILVVDDNAFTLRIVQHALEQAGFQALTAVSGRDALKLINRHGIPHLALVDLHMPMMSGFEFCHAVREFTDMPIIMLTAVNTTDTIVKGIEQYAEDYIIKPFNPTELVARVSRVLRRMGDYDYTLESTTRIDDRLLVNFPNREALVNGDPISLTPTETKLLYILVRNAGRIVTTDFLLDRIWPMQNAHEDRLHVHIHRLRRKIEIEPNDPEYIIAERGTGYRFEADIEPSPAS